MASLEQPIDIIAKATWPITLGESIVATRRAARLTSIRYNASPPTSTRQRAIRPLQKDVCEAIITDNENHEWKYIGKHSAKADSYVLILQNEAGKKEARLEKLDIVALNVVSTPRENDRNVLRKRYEQFGAEANVDDGGREHGDTIPQADNPFDYRHFLDDDTVSNSNEGKSNVNTPLQSATTAKHGASATKRKTEPAQSASKKAKVHPAQKSSTQVPAIRLERKATLKPSADTDHDDGELILENGEDEVPKSGSARQSAMAMALNGSLGRPISLHSAASSPAGMINSPVPERPVDDDAEFDLGGGSDVEMHDADGDVEDFDLPSPVQKASVAKAVEVPVEDDDDDFMKEFTEAMAQEDAIPAPVEEESEEE